MILNCGASEQQKSVQYGKAMAMTKNAQTNPKNLWPICGQNSQHSAVTRWQGIGKNCKTLDFLGGCNFRKDKNLGFCRA
jgi:hypothetical protein